MIFLRICSHAHTPQRHTRTNIHTRTPHRHTHTQEQTRTNTHKHAHTKHTTHTHAFTPHSPHTHAHTFSHTHHTSFFRLQVYQIVSIIRLRVYHHSFISLTHTHTQTLFYQECLAHCVIRLCSCITYLTEIVFLFFFNFVCSTELNCVIKVSNKKHLSREIETSSSTQFCICFYLYSTETKCISCLYVAFYRLCLQFFGCQFSFFCLFAEARESQGRTS